MNRPYFLSLAAASVADSARGTQAAPDLARAGTQVTGGRTYVQSFATAPYPHPSRATGHDYQGTHYSFAGHYDDSSVGIFVPESFATEGGGLDFIVHFYGWRHDVASTFSIYRLREQLVASTRNAILLVPAGPKNAPDSGDGKLELERDGFLRFMNDVAAWLLARRIVCSPAIRVRVMPRSWPASRLRCRTSTSAAPRR